MLPLRTVLELGALVVLLAAAGGIGYQAGSGRVQARWDRAELELERQAREDRAEVQRLASRAAWAQEQTRAALARNLPGARNAIREALSAPWAGPSGPGLSLQSPLGAVRVPRAAIDGLRRASAGASPSD